MTPQDLARQVLADLHKMHEFHSRYEEDAPFVGLSTEMINKLTELAEGRAESARQENSNG